MPGVGIRGGSGRFCLEFPLIAAQPLLQVRHDLGPESLAQCALPYDCHPPARVEEIMPVLPVTPDVGIELGQPELRPGGRDGCKGAAGMTVPETAVNETYRFQAGKHQIGSTGKFPVVKTVSQSAGMKGQTESDLGLRVRAPDSRHHAGSGGLVNYVRHCRSRSITEVCRRRCASPGIID